MSGANSPCRSPTLPRHRAPPEVLNRISGLVPGSIERLAKQEASLYRTTYRKI